MSYEHEIEEIKQIFAGVDIPWDEFDDTDCILPSGTIVERVVMGFIGVVFNPRKATRPPRDHVRYVSYDSIAGKNGMITYLMRTQDGDLFWTDKDNLGAIGRISDNLVNEDNLWE